MSWIRRAEELMAPFTAQRPIDTTVFLGRWPFRRQAGVDTSGLISSADDLGLDRLCVGHIDSVFGFDTRSGNEALLRQTSADERMLPFIVLNPAEPTWQRELDWAIRAGARGVRLTPGYHGYRLTDPATADLVAAARSAALPLQLCIRLEDDRVRHPRYAVAAPSPSEVAALLVVTPEMPALFLCGLRLAEWAEIHAQVGTAMPRRLAADLSFVNAPLAAVETLCAEGFAGAFCYGSTSPVQSAHATALQLATAAITDAQRAALCRTNAADLLLDSEIEGDVQT